MNKILNLRIYTPEKLAVDEVINRINISGQEGNYTILPNHIDYLSSFDCSVINFVKENNEKVSLRLSQGIMVKCGREIQISTFGVMDIRENVVKNDLEEKLKRTLINIETGVYRRKK